MSLCHLYDTSQYLHIQKILSAFENSVSLQLGAPSTLEKHDIYIIELNDVSKENLLYTRDLFKDSYKPLIYFIVPQSHTLIFFQLTYNLGAKDLILHNQNPEKIVKKISSEQKLHQEQTLQLQLGSEYIKEKNTTAIETNVASVKNLSSISSRIAFIELLKEKHIQNLIEKNKLSAISINISNLNAIKESLETTEFEYLLIDTLAFMDSILTKKIIFATLEKSFYVVLFENISDKERKEIATNFNTKMLGYTAEQKNKLFLDIYTLSLATMPFGEILTTLENIFHQKTSYAEQNALNITHISNTQNIFNEKTLLEQAFEHKTPITLLNIYKGLVIKTQAKIIKAARETIYIKFESLQGVVINLEKETILQAASFIHDIQAQVRVIDLQKKIAVLEKFKFLKTNPNARQYSRVTMANKTLISVRFDNGSLNGFIIDISIKSVAISTKYSNEIEKTKAKHAVLVCNIPSNKFENGYLSITLECTIIAVTMKDTENNCKVVCNFDSSSPDISYVADFIYQRQKSLIIELKKTSKLN